MPRVRAIYMGNCPDLTGTATVQYAVGVDAQDHLWFRVRNYDGTGSFRRGWLSLDGMQTDIQGPPEISRLMQGLGIREGRNTLGYLIAALIHEGLVDWRKGAAVPLRLLDDADFRQKVAARIAGGTRTKNSRSRLITIRKNKTSR